MPQWLKAKSSQLKPPQGSSAENPGELRGFIYALPADKGGFLINALGENQSHPQVGI